ncbi:MAG: hypothetical protein K2I03_14235 [Lachnospiraceae bacterium]|nr:hypothetical protein [Lachnospiraceae bacterium]
MRYVRMKVNVLIILVLFSMVLIAGCTQKMPEDNEQATIEPENGYNLLINKKEEQEAKTDLNGMMQSVADIYCKADKGIALNAVVSDETMNQMQDVIKETKCSVTSMAVYSNMDNWKYVENFLNNCKAGKSGSVVIYEIHFDGGIGRDKYIFDGKNIYVLSTGAVWNKENESEIIYTTYTRIQEWEYTDKGWFCYQLCVPEPPEVSEVVDGSCMLRVKPMKDEYKEISKKCVLPLGYQGNNILCSNWNADHMEDLDYNGLFEYLYKLKYNKKISEEQYQDGIPKEDFENLIMEYFPVTSEQIRKYAEFDEENQTYIWVRLGCLNYTPTYFGTSIPEVTDIKENEDGTVTLTIDAVCEMVLCDESVITHKLDIRFSLDGSFKYLGNEILDNGIRNIPEYQHRIR